MVVKWYKRVAAAVLVGALLGGTPVWGDSPTGKVNVNTADQKALEALPGLGPAKAKAVIEYREKHGAFKSVDDLKNVSGIGEKTLEELKDKVSVDGQ
jgi:competence protein ComEA